MSSLAPADPPPAPCLRDVSWACYSGPAVNKICKTYFCKIKINLNSFFLARMFQAISVILSRNPKLYHEEALPNCHQEDKEMLIRGV